MKPRAAPAEALDLPEGHCWLCERPLGEAIEWHHPIPKSRGGREKVPIHPICHRTIHATLSNSELARLDRTALRANPALATFLTWIAGKDPDFTAPTSKRKS